MKRIYLYKMTVDNGGAPCVHNGILSLAICKPKIRSVAPEGAVIFGFAANTLQRDNRLIYIAKVTKKVDGKVYYGSLEYRSRPDCIYRWNEGGQVFSRTRNPFHDSNEDLRHDLGDHPEYKKAWVLLSFGYDNFRYFASSRPQNYKATSPKLKAEIESLTQGHRVKHDDELRDELERLERKIFSISLRSKDTPIPSVSSHRKCPDCSLVDAFTECSP